MKIVAAPDSWTGYASAAEIAERIVDRLAAAGLFVEAVPMADGGVGTGEVLRRAGATASPAMVTGPDGRPVLAATFALGGANLVESCQAVGLHLCPRDPPRPLALSSEGLGQLIRRIAATRDGPIIVGLGGSGTLDGGLGMAQGLGLQVLDEAGAPLPAGACAGDLGRAARLLGSPPLIDRLVFGWSDVGAGLLDSARRFGPQKGADAATIQQVSEGLERWAHTLNRWRAAHGLRPVDPEQPGAGAAGGIGFALSALLDAPLLSGAGAVANAVDLDAALADAEVVITGEGRVDESSFDRKVVSEVSRRARRRGCRLILLAGARSAPLPPPPLGPDLAVFCEDQEGDNRDARLDAALDEVAERLIRG